MKGRKVNKELRRSETKTFVVQVISTSGRQVIFLSLANTRNTRFGSACVLGRKRDAVTVRRNPALDYADWRQIVA